MTAAPHLLRRALAGSCLVATGLALAACGGGGGAQAGASPTEAPSPSSTTSAPTCSQEVIGLGDRADVQVAASAGTGLTAETQAVVDDIKARCLGKIMAMSPEETSALIAQLDPKVVTLLTASAQ